MLNYLFRRLTAETDPGAALFDAVTAEARLPHWYVEGKVPDTLDGRFAMLATVAALVIVRLEREGDDDNQASVALTERFITVMEAEHRELGMGDPTLGKTVRRLVGALARRIELWRPASTGEAGWTETARSSIYKADVSAEALMHSAESLRRLSARLDQASLDSLIEGRLE